MGSHTADAAKSLGCQYCGMIHGPTCPTIKAIEYHPNGSVKRVEFRTASDYGGALSTITPFDTGLAARGSP